MSLGAEPHNEKCYMEARRQRVWLQNDDGSRLERQTTWRHCAMTKAGVAAVSDLEVLVSCSFARLDDWVNTKHAASSETTIEAKLPRSSTCFETATPTRTTPPPAPRVQLRREVAQKASKISVWNHILHRSARRFRTHQGWQSGNERMKSTERFVFDTKTIESFKLTSLAFGMGKH